MQHTMRRRPGAAELARALCGLADTASTVDRSAAVTASADFGPGKHVAIHVKSPVNITVQHGPLDSMQIHAECSEGSHDRFQVQETAAGLGACGRGGWMRPISARLRPL